MKKKKAKKEDIESILRNKSKLYSTMVEIAFLAVKIKNTEKELNSKIDFAESVRVDLNKSLDRAVMNVGFDPSIYTVNFEGNIVEIDEFSFDKTPVEVPWRK